MSGIHTIGSRKKGERAQARSMECTAVLSGATGTVTKSFSKIGWARPLVCSSRNRRPLSHRPAANRTLIHSPLVTGIFVLGTRDRHWCATPQTHRLNELVLRFGLMGL